MSESQRREEFVDHDELIDTLTRLLTERDRLYARADATIDTSSQAVKHSVTRLRALVSTE